MNRRPKHLHEVDSLEEMLHSRDVWSRTKQTMPPDLAASVWKAQWLRRRRRGRLAVALALIGAYLAGVGTMQLLEPVPTTRVVQTDAVAPQVEVTQSRRSPQEPRPEPAATLTRPAAAAGDPAGDIASSSHPASPYARYRNLGDRYLRDAGGIEAATECYALALQRATAQELQIAPEKDSWLLMALKRERQKEA